MDEDVQPWLRVQEGSGKGPHRGQTGQVQGHEDDLIVPGLLWSGKGWACHQVPLSSFLFLGTKSLESTRNITKICPYELA